MALEFVAIQYEAHGRHVNLYKVTYSILLLLDKENYVYEAPKTQYSFLVILYICITLQVVGSIADDVIGIFQ